MIKDASLLQFCTDLLHYLADIGKSFIQVVFVFFMPVNLLILAVVVVGTIDTYFGIKSSKKEGKPYSSGRFRGGYIVNKVVLFPVAILLTYMLDYIALDGLFKLLLPLDNISTKIVTLAIVWNEVRSLDESWIKIKGYSFLEKLKVFINNVLSFRKKINE